MTTETKRGAGQPPIRKYDAHVIQMLEDGKSLRAIGDHLGIHHPQVYRIKKRLIQEGMIDVDK